jgi:ABC-type methionine transport system ATPase subunit
MIKLNNICVNYGSNTILNTFNLEVMEGEFLGIVGPSGIGKSTLLRVIAGLLNPSSGEIWIQNELLSPSLKTKEKQKITKKIGYIFQDFSLFPNMTVFNNLAIVQKEKDNNQIETLLKQFGIYDKKDAYPDELSGGQKQRVAIARALVLNPSILLIDEATSSLDSELTKEFMDYMTVLNKQGMTMVFITHETHLVDTYCSRKYDMKNS